MTKAQKLSQWKARLSTRKTNLARAQRHAVFFGKRVAGAEKKVAFYSRPTETKADRVVKLARTFVGTIEHPAGSNRGPHISDWQKQFMGFDGQPWCGAFAGSMLKAVGVPVTKRIVFTPYILADAKAGTNGFVKLVPFELARKGDLALFDFAPGGDPVVHVGIVAEDFDVHGNGLLKTIEGNTSSGSTGSQDNGGGVFSRERPRSVVVGIARPAY